MTQLSSSAQNRENGRLFYLDNLRTFLTALVICHHVANTYAPSGSWYYMEPQPAGTISSLLLTIFLAVNQSFFMSLFFMVSAYFTPLSFERKGPARFLKNRFLRLGIPLVIYFFLLNPSLGYVIHRFEGETEAGYFTYMATNIIRESGTGPLWFVMTLLIFAVLYVVIQFARPRQENKELPHPLPTNVQILAFVLCIGLLTYIVRIWFPVSRAIFNLQLGYFPLYICMYIFGVWACRYSWLESLRAKQANQWFGASVALIALVPGIMVLLGALESGTGVFEGGLTWQAYMYAALEPLLCVGISLKLLTVFRGKCDTQNRLTRNMARGAYTAYILHPFFVVGMTLFLAGFPLDPLVKVVVASPLAVASCFLVSDIVRRAPLLRRIL